MNLEKIMYAIVGMSAFVLICAVIEHISIRLFGDPTILIVYIAITLGTLALIVLVCDLIFDWFKK